MPEGPELSHSRDRLREILLQGELSPAAAAFVPLKTNASWQEEAKPASHFAGRYRNKVPEGFDELHRLTTKDGAFRVSNIHVKGKFMWWELTFGKLGEPTWWMHVTYGMSGSWQHNAPSLKHVAAMLRYTRNSSDKHVDGLLMFHDPRHFGTLKFVNDKQVHQRKLDSLGPDMLWDPPNDEIFKSSLMKRSTKTIAEVLMDQKVISGCGNYIKAEVLYRARLSPHRTVASLSTNDFAVLRQEIIAVMNESYHAKGATIKTYTTTDGDQGHAQFLFRVYGKSVDALGNTVVKEETLDGRTTHWVPNIQI